MDLDNLETKKIDFKEKRNGVNPSHINITVLVIILVALVVAFVVVFALKGQNNKSASNHIETNIHVSEIEVKESANTCTDDQINTAAKDASKLEFTYRRSNDKFYTGDDLINEAGEYIEHKDSEKEYGIDLVIRNLTKNIKLYIEFSADLSDYDGIEYTYKDSKDGMIYLSFPSNKVTGVSVYVYSTAKDCDTIVKNYDLEVPRYNKVSEDKKCKLLVNEKSQYCATYTFADFDDDVAVKRLKDADEEAKETKVDVTSIVIVCLLFVAAVGFMIYKFR